MIDFLLAVPGKLTTIYTYLTSNLAAARAAKIDNLDAAVSGRAPASTALTIATWTDARAAKLDAIQSSVINSIQSGSITIGAGGFGTATIAAVNTAKTMVINNGLSNNYNASVYLFSAATVRADSNGAPGTVVAFTVVEFK